MRRAFQVAAIACWLLVPSSFGARAETFEVDSEVDDIDASPGDAL